MTLVEPALERTRQQTRRSRFETIFLGGFFTAFCALAFLFPLSGDDWTWGSDAGARRLGRLFENYNGRYAGNLNILFMTRVNILIPLIFAATVTLTIFLLVDLTDNRTKTGYLVVTLLFLAMPQGIWRQSIVWASGFTNYALGALCLLLYLRAAKFEWLGLLRPSVGVRRYVAIFIFGFTSQLFMEHITSYLVLASLASLVLYRIKFGKFSKYGICWVVSFLSGAIVMFSNRAYRTAATVDTKYQELETGLNLSSLASMAHKLNDAISKFAVAQNLWVNITIALLACLLLGLSARTVARSRKVVVLGLATAFLVVALLVRDAEDYLTWSPAFRGISTIAAGLLLVTLFAVACYLVQDERRRLQLYVCCASVVVLIAPLVLVEPIGPRCFYPTYLFFLMIVSVLLKELIEGSGAGARTRMSSFLVAGLAGGVVALFGSHFVIYGTIHKAADERLAYVQAQVNNGSMVVNVKKLPFEGYVHNPDPVGKWAARYKTFYHLPAKLQIVVSESGGP